MKLSFVREYGKSLGAAAFAIFTVVVGKWSGDHHIDPSEGIIIALAIANAITVYIVPLKQEFKAVKSVVNAIAAGLVVAQAQIAGGIDANDILLIVGAVVSALGVTLLPAASDDAHVGKVRVGYGADS